MFSESQNLGEHHALVPGVCQHAHLDHPLQVAGLPQKLLRCVALRLASAAGGHLGSREDEGLKVQTEPPHRFLRAVEPLLGQLQVPEHSSHVIVRTDVASPVHSILVLHEPGLQQVAVLDEVGDGMPLPDEVSGNSFEVGVSLPWSGCHPGVLPLSVHPHACSDTFCPS
jgi:hypothetical protein